MWKSIKYKENNEIKYDNIFINEIDNENMVVMFKKSKLVIMYTKKMLKNGYKAISKKDINSKAIEITYKKMG